MSRAYVSIEIDMKSSLLLLFMYGPNLTQQNTPQTI